MKTNFRNISVVRSPFANAQQSASRIAAATFGVFTFLTLACVSAIASSPATYDWVKSFDAPRGIAISGVAADDAGNAYIAGYFWGRAVIGNSKLASEGESDMFVAKVNPDGEFLWVEHKGTQERDEIYRIGVDASGDLYAYGTFNRQYFISRYDSNGKQLWFKPVIEASSSSLDPQTSFFAVDGKGNSYIAVVPSVLAPEGNLPRVDCLGPDGIQRWSNPLAERWKSLNKVTGIVGRRGGGVVITGHFYDTLKIGGKALIPVKTADFFVACLDPNGAVSWVEQSEASHAAEVQAMAIDGEDSVFVLAQLAGDASFGDKRIKGAPVTDMFHGRAPVLIKYDRLGRIVQATNWSSSMSLVTPAGQVVTGVDRQDRYTSIVGMELSGDISWELPWTDRTLNQFHPRAVAVSSRGDVFVVGPSLLGKGKIPPAGGAISPQPVGQQSGLTTLACAKGSLGEFRHGTKCVGYYDAAQADGKLTLVDIQVAGKTSAKSYTKTKSLIHAGVDIVAPEGSEIRAAANGTVDDVIVSPNDENFRTLGYMVIVEHAEKIGGKPVYSLYLHMKEKPKVTVGQSVKAGETVLGLVGSTGAAFGPHVHFELRRFSGRFFPKWKNIYGIERPKEEATFDESDFAANWLDPEKPTATASVPPSSESASQGKPFSAEARATERTETWTWSNTIRITRQGSVSVTTYERTLKLQYNGDRVTGTIETMSSDGKRTVAEISDSKLQGKEISFVVNSTSSKGSKHTTKFIGEFVGDTIKGKIESEVNGQLRSSDWEAKRKLGSAEPAQSAPTPAEPVKFSALPVNGKFYFMVDTKHENLWTKISADSARNAANSKVAKLPSTVLVVPEGAAP